MTGRTSPASKGGEPDSVPQLACPIRVKNQNLVLLSLLGTQALQQARDSAQRQGTVHTSA